MLCIGCGLFLPRTEWGTWRATDLQLSYLPFMVWFQQRSCRMPCMGFMRKPQLLLRVLQSVIEVSSYRFILFSSRYEPLDAATRMLATETSLCSEKGEPVKDVISLFSDRLFCFSG
ncbi:UDP-glucuronosyl/UDP-glucosyltransferase [Artemisia annua]|uniref:UDP-glucuronosyl/UDP-glucosyltransferase n=1 Tax=Artemisia annua TaxID=35608 RepID=A0A2U1LH84_ARTAN|nr:UDP-glucuronosyl/UDP-glucosyltransferase [Artemisia annua]